MKKLILVLAAALALTLLCSCAKPLPEEPVQADPEPEAPPPCMSQPLLPIFFRLTAIRYPSAPRMKILRSALRKQSRSRWPTGLFPPARTAGPSPCLN